ncbi:MAG: hypothetical protein ACD_15C00190G0002 [uncultured bacterium]|nr:MAG: hypothetical protein ACD_15C00190G0002 [uncultured bacterium]
MKEKGKQELAVGSANLINVDDLQGALIGMPTDDFLKLLDSVVREKGSEKLNMIIMGLEIMQTKSSFRGGDRNYLAILEKALALNPLSFYAKHQNIPFEQVGRVDIINWWTTLMQMAAVNGYCQDGIDCISRKSNFWKATVNLASKMQANPSAYQFLPALLINYPKEVERVLGVVQDPIPFLEILIGEAYEDILELPKLIEAFSLIERDGDISRSVADGILSIHLAMIK